MNHYLKLKYPTSLLLNLLGFISLALALSLLAKPVHADTNTEQELSLNIPPTSLSKWYKPANKRQVWLHTMFRLRREMQAIGEYSAFEDTTRLTKWSQKFVKDYKSIGTMVPQWADELETDLANKLLNAAKRGDFEQVVKTQQKIVKTCNGCHKEYRAISAVIYRTPNFENIIVEDSETLDELSFEQSMKGLTSTMNRIKIAVDDERFEVASNSFEIFTQRLDDLKTSCQSCHKTDRQSDYLMGDVNMTKVKKLGEYIATKKGSMSKRTLGAVAVDICATCHGIHRTVSDLREFIAHD